MKHQINILGSESKKNHSALSKGRIHGLELVSVITAFFTAYLIGNIIKGGGVSSINQLFYYAGGAIVVDLMSLVAVILINRLIKERLLSVLFGFAVVCYFFDSGYIYIIARDEGFSPVKASELKNIYFIFITVMSFGLYFVANKIFKFLCKISRLNRL